MLGVVDRQYWKSSYVTPERSELYPVGQKTSAKNEFLMDRFPPEKSGFLSLKPFSLVCIFCRVYCVDHCSIRQCFVNACKHSTVSNFMHNTWILSKRLFLRGLFTVKQLLLPVLILSGSVSYISKKRMPTKINNKEQFLTKLINISI